VGADMVVADGLPCCDHTAKILVVGVWAAWAAVTVSVSASAAVSDFAAKAVVAPAKQSVAPAVSAAVVSFVAVAVAAPVVAVCAITASVAPISKKTHNFILLFF